MKKFWKWTNQAATETAPMERILHLNGTIAEESWFDDEVTPQMFKDELFAGEGDITVWINSPGGDCVAAAQIYNMLVEYKGAVTVKVDGIAASAASVIAMAGTKVLMSPVSMMMIHNPWTFAAGNSDELREQADVLDMIRDVMVDIYMNRFAGEQADLEAMLSRETWLTPARAMEHGLCDEIETAEDGSGDDTLSASAMAGRYAAMSRAQMDEIRERFGVKKEAAKQPEPMAADRAAELLREADAMIAAAFNI